MDYNNYLTTTMMPIGYYDFYSKNISINSKKNLLNLFCASINIFCGLKTILILIIPNPKIVLYLIELYIKDGYIQSVFHLGLSWLHFATGRF